MSVTLYDEALLNKLKAAVPKCQIVYEERAQFFHSIVKKEGKVKFPAISIFRPDGWSISNVNTLEMKKYFTNGIRQVYFDTTYQIEIWSNTREDLEEITSELVLYLLKNPGFSVQYMSADKSVTLPVKVSLEYKSGPDRSSEIEDSTVGRIFRYTLTFDLQNGVLLVFEDSEHPQFHKITQVIVEIKPEVIVTDIDVTVASNDKKL